MLVILEATAGPATGRKIQVAEGSILRVGRTARSDYALGEDSYLSGQHFAIESMGRSAPIRDLGSSNGTFVNGGPHHGARRSSMATPWRQAAAPLSCTSIYRVPHRSRFVPPAAPHAHATRFGRRWRPPAPTPIRDDSPHLAGLFAGNRSLLNTLYRRGEAVYAVLDAIRDARIPAFLDASGEKYARVDDENPASPYLVLVPGRIATAGCPGEGRVESRVGFLLLRHRRNLKMRYGIGSTFVTLHNRNGQPAHLPFLGAARVARGGSGDDLPGRSLDSSVISRFVVEGDKPRLAVDFTSRRPA